MKNLLYIIGILLFVSCGGTKKIKNSNSAEDITATKLVEEYYSNTLDYSTFEARTRVKYANKDDIKPTVNIQIRIEKDKRIWADASLLGFSGARALITPTNIKFYDKLNKQYFDNDFSFLSEYFGVDLNFDQLQRLLTGQTIYDLREGSYSFEKATDYFAVTPKNNNKMFDLLFHITTNPLSVQKQEVTMKEDNRNLKVNYQEYAEVEGKTFPIKMKVLAKDLKRTTTVDIEYKSININNPLRFPFKMPSGYEEIVIDGI